MKNAVKDRSSLGRTRRGFSLVEATVTVLLLLVAMTTTARGIAWYSGRGEAVDRRAVAIREADNLLERLAAGGEAVPSLSAEAGRALPGGEVEVERASESADGIAMDRITVTVRYLDRSGLPASPVRLTTWVASNPGEGGVDPGEELP